MTTFSPSDAALEGFRLAREHPGRILGWMLFYLIALLLLGFVIAAALGPTFRPLLEGGQMPNEAELGEALASNAGGPLIALILLALFATAVLLGALFRTMYRPEEKAFFGLRFGADEVRLTIVLLVLLVFGYLVRAVTLVGSWARTPDGPPPLAVFAFMMIGYVAVTWACVRLSIIAPLTFKRRRLAWVEGWNMTRGHFWPLFGMLVMTAIFWIIVFLLITVINFAVVALAGGAEAINNFKQLTPGTVLAFVVGVTLELLLPVLQVIMLGAPLGVACEALDEAAAV